MKTPNCTKCKNELKTGGEFGEGQTAFYYCDCEENIKKITKEALTTYKKTFDDLGKIK